MEFLSRIGTLLGLLLLGTALRRGGVLTAERTDWLTGVAFYVALPALIYHSTHDRSPAALLSPALVGGVWLVILGTAAVAVLAHRGVEDRATRSVATAQSYHANLGFLGLPLVAASLGEAAAAKGSIVLGAGVLANVPLTILLLTTMNDADADLASELRGVATNPVLVSLALGLGVATAPVSTPGAVVAVTGALSELALPVALLAVGASLDATGAGGDLVTTARTVALKVGVMPLLALGVFGALAVSQAGRDAAVVMAGTPTAVSTYVYAAELGGDEEFASRTVFASTLVSVGTLFGLLWLVG